MPSFGKPLPHDSAVGHVTGSAPYIDDLPRRCDELYVGFVGSPVACGRIIRLDAALARERDGVVAVLDHTDIKGNNRFGPVFEDECFLAEEQVSYLGQPVVVIAAESTAALAAAQALVRIEATEAEPCLSIERAIERQLLIGPKRAIRRGDPDVAIASAPHVLSGVFRSQGQEQFYLESQAAIAYPAEDGQLVVHSSTQNPTEIQTVVAEVLGLGQHQVVCICKRMGGAFGGKETQAAIPALMVALVASQTNRAARIVYDKDTDMRVTGKRHGYYVEWRVGFDDSGRILGLRADYYSDGGAAADLSTSVMERTLLHAENAYYIPHLEVTGQVCFTNYPPNTAFRGFGGPQAVAAIENIMQRVAIRLGKDAFDVRMTNVYGTVNRNVTPYGQVFERNHLPEIMARLADDCHYRERQQQIADAPRSPLKIRGLALTPVKFGISFTTSFLNQANALVNVYTDGTVQVSTGGTEMGQGLNVKIRQLVADELGVAPDRVVIMTTSTEKNNNTSPTAASAGTDLNGAAAIQACRKIRGRLAEFAARQLMELFGGTCRPEDIRFADDVAYDSAKPDRRIAFGQLTHDARRARVDLGARGFYATPGVEFDRETGQGTPFLYFTQGAAACEVEIDRFTGQLSVPRVDLLIDIGRSINPGVDMGQITGGFIQGMGWVTGECLVYGDSGELLSHSPTTYKIPAITDVPPIFNCDLFDNGDNVVNVRRSKAVGEPPLMLAVAVWAAVHDALARFAPGSPVSLGLPATGEEILRCIEKLAVGSEAAPNTAVAPTSVDVDESTQPA